ncbi:hypothetical protein [Staphylococcus pseudintermedius]|uniref:hypothetical protein n=1 Tax=Staphylococcus pseudintermedius TaxID=283734 RepID=UPI002B487DFD|nr:hypothetical protein [Staphylococcus pseudintermedius]
MNNDIIKYFELIGKIYYKLNEFEWLNIDKTNIRTYHLQLESNMISKDSYCAIVNQFGLNVVISRIEYEDYDMDGEKQIYQGYAMTFLSFIDKPIMLKNITSKEYNKYLLDNYDRFEGEQKPNLKEIFEIAKEKSLDLPKDFFDI